jgi:hypothetical protein
MKASQLKKLIDALCEGDDCEIHLSGSSISFGETTITFRENTFDLDRLMKINTGPSSMDLTVFPHAKVTK